jgi:branched-chain amino acid transport system ATP-binding protein
MEVKEVYAAYGKRPVLEGVSLALRPGEIVAVIGPNGAGKSSLLKVIAGFLPPIKGAVVFAGKDITRWPPYRRARAGIGFLPQAKGVFPSLTPEEHFQLARSLAARRGALGQRASFPFQSTLEQSAEEPAGLLSGGQRQVLALEAALAGEPTVLLADEPSAGLAPKPASELLEALAAASRDRGLAVLWVEQRVGQILALADRALALQGGRIAAATDHPREWLEGDILTALAFGGGV